MTDETVPAVTDEQAAQIKTDQPEVEPEDAGVLGPDDEADPFAEGVQ
jgi:hypothetical protein